MNIQRTNVRILVAAIILAGGVDGVAGRHPFDEHEPRGNNKCGMKQDFKREHTFDFYDTLDSIGACVQIVKGPGTRPNYSVSGATLLCSDGYNEFYGTQLPVGCGHRILVTERLALTGIRPSGFRTYGWPNIWVSDPIPMCINRDDSPINPLFKQTRGIIVPLNNNDSDSDQIPDIDDEYVEDDPDLIPVRYKWPRGMPCNLSWDNNIIHLYERRSKKYGYADTARCARVGANIRHAPYSGYDDNTFFVEGVDGGTTLLAITSPNGAVGDKIKISVLKVDLDVDANYDGSIDDADDYSEESPGGLVVHSDYWDDRPLTKIIIQKVQPEDLDCSVDLSISAGISKIELFEDFFGTQQITFFPVTYQNSDLPKTLWVRSWDTSDALGDIEFQLQLNTIAECQDIVRVTSIEVEYTNTVNQKYGFDGETDLPIYWKSIKWSDSDTAFAKMDPIAASTRVKFSSSSSGISVSPSSASTSPETLTITSPGTTDSSIGADLGAVDYLRAAFLNVKNFSLVEKRVALYHVVEGGGNISPTDTTSAASIQTYLNESVYNQGVASFTVHDFGMTNVNYDFNSDGKMEYDYPNPLSSEAQEIRAAIPLPPTYDYVVYHVHDITGVNGLASRIDTYAFVRDGSLSIRNLIAHELGHAFGNLPDGGPSHWLMNNTGNCDEGKMFLPKAHWDLIDSRHR